MLTPLRIAGFTRTLGPPEDWDERHDGPCISLPIRDEVLDGIHFMTTRYEFSPEDIANIVAGRPLELSIAGMNHPVIRISVTVE